MKSLGDKIKKIRTEQGLTIKEAANLIGIKEPTLNSYESNYRNPGLHTLIKIAKAYNTSLDYLIGIEKLNNINKTRTLKEIEDIKRRIIALEEYIKETK